MFFLIKFFLRLPLKEQIEKLTEEKDKLNESEQRNSEGNKRLSRQLRDIKDELADVQRHEAEAIQRKHDLVIDFHNKCVVLLCSHNKVFFRKHFAYVLHLCFFCFFF